MALRPLLRSLLRYYPLQGGYRSICMRLKAYTRPCDKVGVRLRSGPRLFVNTSEHLGNIVYWMGDSDPRITRLCKTLLRPGDTGLDIGTNNGVEALTMAAAVGAKGKVVACEANPAYHPNLEASLDANGFDQVELKQAAVTDHTGTVTFEASGVTGRISDEGLTVPAVHARDLFADLAPIQLVKIDAEGHEATILRGAAEAIRQAPPKYILFESHPGRPFWERDEVQTLDGLGYQFHHITRALFGSVLRPVERGQEVGSGFDFLATYPE